VANRSANTVSVLLGNGDGTFQSANDYDVGIDPLCVAVGDFNGDNRKDLAVANAAIFDDPPNVSVLLAKNNGPTFPSPVNYVAGTSPRSIAINDLNVDGKLDLAVANYGAFDTNGQFVGSSISVMLGNGNGTFQAPVNYSSAS